MPLCLSYFTNIIFFVSAALYCLSDNVHKEQ